MNPTPIPHRKLSKAPIVEAVIDIRTMPVVNQNQETLRAYILSKLPGYSNIQSMFAFQSTVQMKPDGKVNSTAKDGRWVGYKCSQPEGKYIIQWRENGFAMSRLAPYDSWDVFLADTLAVFAVYMEFTKITQVNQLGVRFINRIEYDRSTESIDTILTGGNHDILGAEAERANLFHQDSFALRSKHFVNIIKAMEPNAMPNQKGAVILDVDVIRQSVISPEATKLKAELTEMRVIKNNIFFQSISKVKLEQLA